MEEIIQRIENVVLDANCSRQEKNQYRQPVDIPCFFFGGVFNLLYLNGIILIEPQKFLPVSMDSAHLATSFNDAYKQKLRFSCGSVSPLKKFILLNSINTWIKYNCKSSWRYKNVSRIPLPLRTIYSHSYLEQVSRLFIPKKDSRSQAVGYKHIAFTSVHAKAVCILWPVLDAADQVWLLEVRTGPSVGSTVGV